MTTTTKAATILAKYEAVNAYIAVMKGMYSAGASVFARLDAALTAYDDEATNNIEASIEAIEAALVANQRIDLSVDFEFWKHDKNFTIAEIAMINFANHHELERIGDGSGEYGRIICYGLSWDMING